MQVGLVSSCGLHGGGLRIGELDSGEDKQGSDETGGDGAEGVEGLGEIEAAFAGGGGAELGDEGVGGSFKEGQATGDHELSDEEKTVKAHLRGGVEEQAAGSEENEAGDDAELVAEFVHELASGDGEQEVTKIEPDLDASRAGAVDLKRLHELADEDVIEVVGDGPEEEEGGDYQERDKAAMGDQRGVEVARLGWSFFCAR